MMTVRRGKFSCIQRTGVLSYQQRTLSAKQYLWDLLGLEEHLKSKANGCGSSQPVKLLS